MKNTKVVWLVSLILGVFALGSLSAEELTVPPTKDETVAVPGENPQFAYRILMGYLQGKEKEYQDSNAFRVGFSLTLGVTFLGSAGLAYAYGDDISQRIYGKNMDTGAKIGTVAGLSAAGLLFTGLGAYAGLGPKPDFRYKYSEALNAENRDYQEALAAAALKSIGTDARNARYIGGASMLAVPFVAIGTAITMNVTAGKPWYNKLEGTSYNLVSLASAIATLMFPTPEEGLYDKYLLAKSFLESN